MNMAEAIRRGLVIQGHVRARTDVTKAKGYVRITLTDVALKNPDVRRAAKALVRAMGHSGSVVERKRRTVTR